MTRKANSYFIRISGRHLGFPVEEASEEDGIGTVEKLDPENIGVAAGILFLSSVELEKSLGVILPPPHRWLRTCVKNRWVYEG